MEGYTHDSIGQEKSFLHAISMMHINIDIQSAGLVFEEFQNAQDNIIGVAESGGLALLGMMESATPVDGDVSLLVHQKVGCINRAATTQLTKFIEPGKARTVSGLVDVELSFLFGAIYLVCSLLLRLEHSVIGVHEAL
jgi:hypothetical protein